MSETSTGAGSEGTEGANNSDPNATGGESTENAKNDNLNKLQKQFDGQSKKYRELDKKLTDMTSKFDQLLTKLSAGNDDEDDDDDDDDGDGQGGGEGAGNKTRKTDGEANGGKNPEARKLLKKLDRERKASEERDRAAKEREEGWKKRFERTELKRILSEEMSKLPFLDGSKQHVIKLVESDIEINVDDDGIAEASHKDYPSISKFLEEFLTENPMFAKNTKAGGTGDSGGAEKSGSSGGGLKFPAGFKDWSHEKQRDHLIANPELRKAMKNSAF